MRIRSIIASGLTDDKMATLVKLLFNTERSYQKRTVWWRQTSSAIHRFKLNIKTRWFRCRATRYNCSDTMIEALAALVTVEADVCVSLACDKGKYHHVNDVRAFVDALQIWERSLAYPNRPGITLDQAAHNMRCCLEPAQDNILAHDQEALAV